MPDVLFTVGHSTHPTDTFVELLARHRITALGDVRSQPYSRFNPQFNRETLAADLKAAGIAYVYLGDQLGARIDDPRCRVDGQLRFERVAEADFFRAGLERVRGGLLQFRLALMCAERDPITCHRMILVTRNLRAPELRIAHVRADGTLESNAEAERRLLAAVGLPDGDLFRDRAALIEQAYEEAGRRMTAGR